ncbi:hypothetical protein M2459_001015 [Parabacteroides sp. PF5-5]|uniref:hypothetical protein n=1 Tax=unclassified Parabacteroides TaxID=2649774 RepID=UPI0024734C19|nr:MULTISPECIES: hypothetical protein [unclassified Parabacteroides]MDH6304287.1 hypothetical protein [Parabacteroides sp. PH5-39]MDH6314998.1 hypothetical protein [Parabacteroides sp. PF5-13]MDH6318658.1 hypothetical protein [Parabacteroides sp. PH5-13]MDH6322388.1 hypothetical protein [Parabacteroides sp. PH5-8]MDH6326477.1 hypothetical protein [Parabacteroides sp. PH5-41]
MKQLVFSIMTILVLSSWNVSDNPRCGQQQYDYLPGYVYHFDYCVETDASGALVRNNLNIGSISITKEWVTVVLRGKTYTYRVDTIKDDNSVVCGGYNVIIMRARFNEHIVMQWNGDYLMAHISKRVEI